MATIVVAIAIGKTVPSSKLIESGISVIPISQRMLNVCHAPWSGNLLIIELANLVTLSPP